MQPAKGAILPSAASGGDYFIQVMHARSVFVIATVVHLLPTCIDASF